MFIDADDWVEPEMIESLHELILKHQAGVSACRYVESHQTEFLSRDEKKRWTGYHCGRSGGSRNSAIVTMVCIL